jgi:hypothetical protein
VPIITDEAGLSQKKKQRLFVIIARSKQKTGSGMRYIANDGSTTTSKSKAARFWTFWDAKAYAEVNRIILNAHTYIDGEIFTELETQG